MAKKPAKKTAKKRKAPASRSAAGPKAGVDTRHAINAMEKVLEDLEKAKQGDTNWNLFDKGKVRKAERKLRFLKSYIRCPPKSATMSFP